MDRSLSKITEDLTVDQTMQLFNETGLRWILEDGKISGYEIHENGEENMNDNIIENSRAAIKGEIVSDFTYSHEVCGEGFYIVDVSVPRLSDNYDVIPVMISDRLINIGENYKGTIISVCGQFRSYNRQETGKNKLMLYVFARTADCFVEDTEDMHLANQIYLDGFICKEPLYRKTPLGREITDLFVAVNRPYGKTDYIPCICWGRTAVFAATLSIGEHCIIQGRIQSREYIKKLDDENTERRVAFEVSVKRLDIAEEDYSAS